MSVNKLSAIYIRGESEVLFGPSVLHDMCVIELPFNLLKSCSAILVFIRNRAIDCIIVACVSSLTKVGPQTQAGTKKTNTAQTTLTR